MTTLAYYLLFIAAWLIALMPFRLLYWISDFLFVVIYYLVSYRKKVVRSNLRTSFPDKSDREIEILAKAFYRHFCDMLLESIKGLRVSLKELNRRFQYLNPEVLHDLEARNIDFTLVSAHYNNWEWLIGLSAILKNDFLVIYRPLKNKAVDRLTGQIRSRFGAVLIPMDLIFRHSLQYRSNKKNFSIWFLADQRPPRTAKFWTNFLNHETAFFEGVGKISAKLNMAVVFMDIQKIGRGHYEVTFRLIEERVDAQNEQAVMLRCIKEMEQQICLSPEFWLWTHKRFKHARPDTMKLTTL